MDELDWKKTLKMNVWKIQVWGLLERVNEDSLFLISIAVVIFCPSDFPQERCPVVLAPLLYPEKRDILMDRILPDSGGVAKTMMESSLADFMQEVGYGFCARLV